MGTILGMLAFPNVECCLGDFHLSETHWQAQAHKKADEEAMVMGSDKEKKIPSASQRKKKRTKDSSLDSVGHSPLQERHKI